MYALFRLDFIVYYRPIYTLSFFTTLSQPSVIPSLLICSTLQSSRKKTMKCLRQMCTDLCDGHELTSQTVSMHCNTYVCVCVLVCVNWKLKGRQRKTLTLTSYKLPSDRSDVDWGSWNIALIQAFSLLLLVFPRCGNVKNVWETHEWPSEFTWNFKTFSFDVERW